MPLSHRWTLTRYLIEERRRFPGASGDLNALILDISLACKAIARIVAFGSLGDSLGTTGVAEPAGGATNVQGEVQKPLDVMSNEIFIRMNEWSGHLAGLASEEMDEPKQVPSAFPRGKYLLVFDPLDGSSNIDVNVSVGSIFSILRAPPEVLASGRDVTEADFLQPGATQVAAGYAIYGPTTMLVLSVGNGVAGFTLNPNLGEFVLTHPNVRVPLDTTALPSVWTCIMSWFAFSLECPKSLRSTNATYDMRLIGSFQTRTTHGASRSVSEVVSGSRTSTGDVELTIAHLWSRRRRVRS